MSKSKLLVNTESTSYPIYIQAGLLNNSGEFLNSLKFTEEINDLLLISNETVFPLYGTLVEKELSKLGKEVHTYLLPDGEQFKSWDVAEEVLAFALERRLTRKTLLVALGGGVVGDLAGFIAAIYLRGIPFIQIPTTLLAQVDSSVGGKVAVNHPLGKNMIGAFYHPQAVLMDLNTLNSLPEREWLAGLAEVLKYGVIWDCNFFEEFNQKRDQILARDPQVLTKIIHRCCEIKAEIVGEDELEKGLRAILNFGHTIGHALERVTNYQVYRHGEAVALGMIVETKLAEQLGLLDPKISTEIISTLKLWGFPTELPDVDHDKIVEATRHDKKNMDNNITFILPSAIGSVEVVKIADLAVIKQVLAEIN